MRPELGLCLIKYDLRLRLVRTEIKFFYTVVDETMGSDSLQINAVEIMLNFSLQIVCLCWCRRNLARVNIILKDDHSKPSGTITEKIRDTFSK